VAAPDGEQLIVEAALHLSWRFTIHATGEGADIADWPTIRTRPEQPEYDDEDDETLTIFVPVGTTVTRT
jgi:hypothetical protein